MDPRQWRMFCCPKVDTREHPLLVEFPGVCLFEFATTLLSLGYWMQCPVSGVQFEFL